MWSPGPGEKSLCPRKGPWPRGAAALPAHGAMPTQKLALPARGRPALLGAPWPGNLSGSEQGVDPPWPPLPVPSTSDRTDPQLGPRPSSCPSPRSRLDPIPTEHSASDESRPPRSHPACPVSSPLRPLHRPAPHVASSPACPWASSPLPAPPPPPGRQSRLAGPLTDRCGRCRPCPHPCWDPHSPGTGLSIQGLTQTGSGVQGTWGYGCDGHRGKAGDGERQAAGVSAL